MNILLLSRYSRLAASSRLRSYQYLGYLSSNGIATTSCPLFDDQYVRDLYEGSISWTHVIYRYIRRLGDMVSASEFDAVWIEKEALPWIPAVIEKQILPASVPVILDYDDAVFHRYDHHPSKLVRVVLGQKIDSIMRSAALVIVGNDYLRERAERSGARRVEIVPTVIDLNRYNSDVGHSKSSVVVGWIGNPGTAPYLHLIAPVVKELAASDGLRFVAVGAAVEQLAGLPIDVRVWSEDTEVESIRTFDIGIMPLPDGDFERGKCGYKLIQYMALGKPVVASPVGVNRLIVDHGKNGFLASSLAEWREALRALSRDAKLRVSMGRVGRRKVEQELCLTATAGRLAELIRSVA